MEERADELYESWVNGNRKHVIVEVATQKNGTMSALLAVLVCMRMSEQEAHTFRAMLMNRVDS